MARQRNRADQATLPEEIAFDRLVDLAKRRWRIERDHQELKQELGLGDYEGRGWHGFAHHATLYIAAYGFLIPEGGAPPLSRSAFSAPLAQSAISEGYRPRAAPNGTPPNSSSTVRRRLIVALARNPSEVPLLQRTDPQGAQNSRLLTQ